MAFKYDVFISFRGEDTRYNFIGFLHKELFRKGISAFVDDKDLKIGQGISPSLSEAIEESKILLVVFSQNYASSMWCLDELVKIIDCSKRNNSKQLVFPIFYHVDPSHIRHQRNEYGKAMTEHKERFGEGSQRVQAWISALSEAANFPGQHITGAAGYECKIIETIVEKIFGNIPPKPLHIDQVPIGLEHRIEEVMSILDMKPNDDSTVCMLGIYGTGGIGKTELAKALYNKIAHQFEAACFLAHVREKSKNGFGMEDLQKTLMLDMLKELGTGLLGSTCKGSGEIKRKLKHKMVLLVLDDVDETKQLDELAGGCDWFGPGSRIIITTRNKKCLDQRVEHKYRMTELSAEHSLGLFCWNAFKQSHPAEGFEHVSSRAIRYAKGLPLALKVIGSDMATKTLTAWETALKDYKKTEEYGRIQDVLKISYNGLKPYAQQVFLDIACFFKGEKIDHVKMILEEFNATSNIDLLVDKSLITVEHDRLMMHDLLQDMGRDVVMQEKPTNPGERSRLWHWKDVIEVLTEDYAGIEIQGIMLDPPERQEVVWSGTAFKKMKRLRILIVRNTSFSQEPKNLPNHLRVMDWEDYPGKSFPSEFHPKDIIIFNLHKSHLTLEKPFKKFSCLTKMNFSYSHSISEMPDVSEAPNIRELRLDNCKNLITVHKSVGFLQNLVHLSASECTKLRNFLQCMFLPSLELLDLNSCIGLEHFPEVVEKMDKPLKIYMIDTAIKELPNSIGKLTGLVSIEMPSSKKLTNLPNSLFTLPNFVAIKIGGSLQLRESFRRFAESHLTTDVPPTLQAVDFENGGLLDEDLRGILNCFPNLEELVARENNFVYLPICIKKSVHLSSLDVSLCKMLQQIPECCALRILDVHGCVKLKYISELPSTTRKVDARHCSSLTRETSDMLWCQVRKEIRGLEIVMPMRHKSNIPEWFHFFSSKEGAKPGFRARGGNGNGKFPVFTLALVFQDPNKVAGNTRRQLVELELVINSRHVPHSHKGYYNFTIAPDHVLIVDPRVLFSDQEWHGLDALLNKDWNVVQVSYETTPTLTLSCWGVFFYERDANLKHVEEFVCPDSDMLCTSPRTTTRDRKLDERIKMIQSLDIDKIYTRTMMESINLNPKRYKDEHFAAEVRETLMRGLKEIQEQAQNPSAALEDKNSILSRVVETIEKKPVNGDPVDVGNGLVLLPLPHGVGLPMDQLKFHTDIGVGPSTSGQERRGYVRVYANSELEEAPFYVSDPQQQEIMDELFREGMTVGLVEAQKSFPNLNIEAITSNFGLNKGLYRLEWGIGVCGNHVLPPPEEKIHIEGVINGLLEAKVSFPDLDVPTTAITVLRRRGIELDLQDFTTVKAPSSHLGETSSSGDSQMDFYKGVMDGLVEAHKSLSSLDVNKTASAALDKRKRVAIWSVPKGEEGNASSTSMIPPDEVKLYVEGIMNGLLEAKLGFLDLDVRAILNTVLDERNIKLPFVPFLLVSELDWNTVMPPPLKQFFYKGMQDALVEAQKAFPDLNIDTTFSEASINVPRAAYTLFGEAHDQLVPVEMKISIDGIVSGLHQAKLSFPDLDVEATLVATLHRQGSPDPKQQEMMDEMFCTGMWDGLVEAQKRFPNLDIATAFRAVLISGERHTLKLFEEGRKLFPIEIKIYIEGILSGLGPVKLSFPSLDIWAILNILLNRKGYAGKIGPPMALPSNSDTGHPSSDDPLLEAFIMMNQQESETKGKLFCKLREKHKALRKKFEEIQAAPDKDAIDTPSWKTQYDELIEKFNTKPAHEFIATSSKYDKVGAVLKGRAKELQRLCDDGIEGYKKSQVFQDLMSAMYLDGLRDGFLEAQTILFAAGIPQEEKTPHNSSNSFRLGDFDWSQFC